MDILNKDNSAFDWSPSFGVKASFSSLNDEFIFGDNHKKMMSRGINSLSMSLGVEFNIMTDTEVNEILSFLQSHFYYDPQDYNTAGKFNNKRITPFAYQPPFPYKTNNFYCNSFKHDKKQFNNNSVSASFACAHATSLDSIETYRGFNNDGEYQNIDSCFETNEIINKSPDVQNIGRVGGVCNEGFDLQPNVNIFATGSYANVEIVSRASDGVAFVDLKSNFSITPRTRFNIPNTPSRSSIFINNPNECSYYPYNPHVEGGTIKTRMFDFRPSSSISINHTPKFLSSSSSEIYKKYAKYGFNPNLHNLNLKFNQRDDLEAKRILLFLESHLGHKKFGFHLPSEYRNSISDAVNTTPHRRTFSHFYCPEWTHSYTYKDNHNIDVTFIECLDY